MPSGVSSSDGALHPGLNIGPVISVAVVNSHVEQGAAAHRDDAEGWGQQAPTQGITPNMVLEFIHCTTSLNEASSPVQDGMYGMEQNVQPVSMHMHYRIPEEAFRHT